MSDVVVVEDFVVDSVVLVVVVAVVLVVVVVVVVVLVVAVVVVVVAAVAVVVAAVAIVSGAGPRQRTVVVGALETWTSTASAPPRNSSRWDAHSTPSPPAVPRNTD
jgi:hypothetical protein